MMADDSIEDQNKILKKQKRKRIRVASLIVVLIAVTVVFFVIQE